MKKNKYGISISEFDVNNDGSEDASIGIQKALDSDNRLVYIPYGKYRIDKGLKIGSCTKLTVHPQAYIYLNDNAGRSSSDFLISNKNKVQGDVDIEITGGIWDGNNLNNPRGSEGDIDAYTGSLFNMTNVENLNLNNLYLKDSTAYFIRLIEVRHFRVENIKFQINNVTRNQDGIHCAGLCEYGEIHNIEAHGLNTTGDDVIALNADDALLRSELLGAKAGPIKNINISNIRADDCHSFIRLASIWSEISNIDIRGIIGGCRNYLINADSLRYCAVPLFDSNNNDYMNGVGKLTNIRLSDSFVFHSKETNEPLVCLESRMDNFTLSNIRRDIHNDANPEGEFLCLKNIIQKKVILEHENTNSQSNLLGEKYMQVIGNKDLVRYESNIDANDALTIHTNYLASLFVSDPILSQLPEMNCMIGLDN